MSEVAILGCGPAGLLAALAVEQEGHEPRIFSHRPAPSRIAGAQYLHTAIPDLTAPDPDTMIRFIKVGDREGYAAKVYGSPHAPCSWDAFPEGEHPAWSLEAAYRSLWNLYGPDVKDYLLSDQQHRFEDIQRVYPLVISTIPAWVACQRTHDHVFNAASVWIRTNSPVVGSDVIEYNGDPLSPWYRRSSLFDHYSAEYGHYVPDAIEGRKPLNTNCDCRPWLKRLGRFGQWRKGVLLDDAYREAREAVRAL